MFTSWLVSDCRCSPTAAVMPCSCTVPPPTATLRSSSRNQTISIRTAWQRCWPAYTTTPPSPSPTRTPTSCPTVASTSCLALVPPIQVSPYPTKSSLNGNPCTDLTGLHFGTIKIQTKVNTSNSFRLTSHQVTPPAPVLKSSGVRRAESGVKKSRRP